MTKDNADNRKRKIVQLIMSMFLPLIIIGGIFWPYLGYIVLGMMLFFLALAIFKGRLWCGWMCPRGAFLERYIPTKRKIPPLLKSPAFRWSVFAGLMGFMIVRLILSGGDPAKIGTVFVMMCIITTAIAIPLALVYRSRTWCSFCPMGTLQGLLGKRKNLVHISQDCLDCGKCQKVCPVDTHPPSYQYRKSVTSEDCLRCGECVGACPVDALTFKDAAKK